MVSDHTAGGRPAAVRDDPSPSATARTSAAGVGWLVGAFAATILVSAFLLFQVQPLISKSILPWFGGSPAVWTTCMLFFQVVLFGGYAYAHLAQRFLPPSAQAVVHLGLLAGALALLPIAPDPSWKPRDAGDPTGRILALLAVSVGLPYLVLSATGPLVQSWFSRAFPGRSPFRLYALSNFGSLAALVSNPFLVEPMLAVGRQARAWSGGFGLFALLCGACAVAVGRRGRRPAERVPATEPVATVPPTPGPARWLVWLALPSLASLTLLATTNHVCQDVAVMPFLWVVPLGLYLLSFIIAFDHERWYRRGWFAPAAAVAVVVLSALDGSHFAMGFAEELALPFAGLFLICMLCHGELVRLRPDPAHLTLFYLAIAAGGALGGMFVSLLAPLIFSTYLEWKIALAAAYLLALGLLLFGGTSRRPRVRPAFGALGVFGLGMLAWFQAWFGGGLERSHLGRFYSEGYRCSVLARTRDFYGVNTVLERHHPTDPRLDDRALFSGQIPHGVQLTEPSLQREATTYYGPESGVGLVLRWFAERPGSRVGIIGLGAGTLATYARPGDSYRIYEINPAVERLARQYFRTLSDCRGDLNVVLGDARLSLEREPPQRFDVLVLDAFTGDAIPTHLLTREALEVYRRHLAPDGVLAVHISNYYLDLMPVVRGLADHSQMPLRRVTTRGDHGRTLYDSDWVLLTRNPGFLRAIAPPVSTQDGHDRSILWTDDWSNLFEIL